MVTRYVYKRISDEGMDTMRIQLSVREKKLSPEPHCDFCGDPNPTVVYASNVMSTGERTPCWRWCACVRCHELVIINDWETVIHNLTAWLAGKLEGVPPSMCEEAARHSFKDFLRYAQTIPGGGR